LSAAATFAISWMSAQRQSGLPLRACPSARAYNVCVFVYGKLLSSATSVVASFQSPRSSAMRAGIAASA
jgi:hypothetical protein